MKKFEKPIRTDIQWNGTRDSSMFIIGETDKAYLFVISKLVRKGTSMVSNRIEHEQWIPKTIWDKENNFNTYNLEGDGIEITSFNPKSLLINSFLSSFNNSNFNSCILILELILSFFNLS